MKKSIQLLLLALLLPLFLGATPATATWQESSHLPATLDQPLPQDPMQVTIHRLSNGLTVYLSPDDQQPKIVARIAVKAGSAKDPDDSTGIAHYLEHMLFKGSERLGTTDYAKEKVHLDKIRELYEQRRQTEDPAEKAKIYAAIDEENQKAVAYAIPNEIDKLFSSMGVEGVNAGTSLDYTVYLETLPKNRLEAWARLQADRFAHPVFRLFQSEIEAVYEEKNRSLDNADRAFFEALLSSLFPAHPYGRSGLGSIEHLKNPSMERLSDFISAYYRPNNMAMILSGDFDRDEALKIITKYFQTWEPAAVPPPPQRVSKGPKGPVRVTVPFEAEEVVGIAWKTVSVSDPDEKVLALMDMVADNAQSGLINLRLNQTQAVKWAHSGADFLNEDGLWILQASPKEGQSLADAESKLMGIVTALQKGEFSQEDLDAILLNYEIALKTGLESASSRAGRIFDAYVTGREWTDELNRLSALKQVKKEDVIRVAKKYLGKDRVVVYRVKGKPIIPSIEKPNFTEVKIEQGRQSGFFKDLLDLPAKPIEPKWVEAGRDYQVTGQAFGSLTTVKNPVNDLFSLDFQFDRGFVQERRLCEALNLLNLAGAGDLDAEAFKKKLYALGIGFDTYCSNRRSGVTLFGPEQNLTEALSLMRARFDAPNLKADDWQKRVAVLIGQHKDNKIDKDAIFSALADWVQRREKGDTLRDLSNDELRALKEEDLKSLLKSFFDYKHRVSFVGTLNPDEVTKALAVGEKTYLPTAKAESVLYRELSENEVTVVGRDMVQARVGLFFPTEIVNPQRRTPQVFYSEYLSGGLSSLIFQEVREARSLAYSASGSYRSGAFIGDQDKVLGNLACQADKTVEASALMSRLLREPTLSEERFNETKKSILESFSNDRVRFRAIPGFVWGWEDFGFTEDPRPARFKEAKKFKLKDLKKFTKAFKDKPLAIYVLGDQKRINVDELKKLGTFTEKKVDELFPY